MSRSFEPVPAVAPAPEGTESGASAVPYQHWWERAEVLQRQFVAGLPYPHLVLDDFLCPQAAARAAESFPPPGDGWIHYMHYNQHTFGMNDRRFLPEALTAILDELNSEPFLALLGALTGIPSLCADPSLEGGGLHQSERGGYLNLHSDFTVHPHRPHWRRRLNLLIYLNPGWDESWGGHLELWDRAVQRCVQRVAPLHNRALLFRTDQPSIHGYPDPLRCPENVTRKTLALYYFTAEASPPRAVSTEYTGRPGDGARRVLIYLEQMVLRVYDRAKRTFGFDDAFANRILRALSRRHRPR